MTQNPQAQPIRCVLFDLDGTLFDTSYDFCYALNLTCEEFGVQAPSYSRVRNTVSQGGAAVTALAFDSEHADFEQHRLAFLNHYRQHIALHSQVFPGLMLGLQHLAQRNIPWGIVTNKPQQLTHELLQNFAFPSAPQSIICGDTLSVKKPAPQPMWLAAQQCDTAPQNCLYLGDHPRDIEAGINAEMQTGAALFGYLPENRLHEMQQADWLFRTPYDISAFLKKVC